MKAPKLRNPPEAQSVQGSSSSHHTCMVRLCGSRELTIEESETFVIDLFRRQDGYVDGPTQTYERYYRSQVKEINLEAHAGCSFISVALGRYAQTSEAVEDALYCNTLNLLSNILRSQTKTAPFARLLHLSETAYAQEETVLTAHMQSVLKSTINRSAKQLELWHAVFPTGLDVFELDGYMEAEKQIKLLLDLSIDIEGDRRFRPGFRAELLELLKTKFPWAQDFIDARAEQEAVDRQRLLNLHRLALLTNDTLYDMLD